MKRDRGLVTGLEIEVEFRMIAVLFEGLVIDNLKS